MKKAEVLVGGRYRIRVGDNLTTVRVTGVSERCIGQDRFVGTNEATGREVRFTAAKLRGWAASTLYHGAPCDGTCGETPGKCLFGSTTVAP